MLLAGARSISLLEITVTCFDAILSGKLTLEAVTINSSNSVGGMESVDVSIAICSIGLTEVACAAVRAHPASTPIVTALFKLLNTL